MKIIKKILGWCILTLFFAILVYFLKLEFSWNEVILSITAMIAIPIVISTAIIWVLGDKY